ncbi:hypothetical protein ACJX0J_033284, partial [Zea mays]
EQEAELGIMTQKKFISLHTMVPINISYVENSLVYRSDGEYVYRIHMRLMLIKHHLLFLLSVYVCLAL